MDDLQHRVLRMVSWSSSWSPGVVVVLVVAGALLAVAWSPSTDVVRGVVCWYPVADANQFSGMVHVPGISIPSRPYLCHGKSRRLLELEGLVFSGTKFVCRMSSNLTSPHSCFHAPVQGVLPEVELGFSCSKQNVFAKSRVVRIRMRNASGRLLEHKWARMLAQPVANCSFPVTISSWPHAIATHTSTDTKQKETRTCTDCTCTFARAHAYVDRRHTHTDRQRQMRADTPGT